MKPTEEPEMSRHTNKRRGGSVDTQRKVINLVRTRAQDMEAVTPRVGTDGSNRREKNLKYGVFHKQMH